MKRLVAAVSAVLVALSGYAGVQAAALPTTTPETQSVVTVTSKDGLYKASVVNESITKETASLRSVIYAPDSLAVSGASASQTFEVTSESEKGLPTDVFLRLSTDTASKDALYDATKLLKTYEITVKDSEGDTVYSSADSETEVVKAGSSEYVLDIFLGRFNDADEKDKATYTLEVKLPKNMTASEIKNLKKISWQAVSDPVEAGATEVPKAAVKEEETPAVTAPVATPTTAVAAATAVPSATAAPSATAEPSATPATSLDSNSSKKVGKGTGEIPPGRYTITASNKEAVVKVYDADGKLDSTYAINEKTPSVVVELKDGYRIDNEGAIDLKEYRTPTASPTATPKAATTTTTRTTTATARPTATPAASKSNPKTGDSAPIAGASALAVFALGMIAYPSLEKKRNKKD